ncbi:meiosis-specific coiled-coil domain-containing protein MEIOC-like isoform X2 [Rhinatrema bivittatum]|nr:meiosis-specific coiled-coil domain-containing protein MEIOC-like isoform X2 [Rhinatrema bivittatum]XP_029444175.1 meiosis-specific coiled-coil domain-containing protein MEIOC-like isoform X2 [Rhinatrema bivittatum]
MDTQLFSPFGIASTSPPLESSRLYSNWSVCGDDPTALSDLQDSTKKRAPVNLSYSGNGPDMFGLVSSILEEPNKLDPVTDWNSLSKLFPPVWVSDIGDGGDYSGHPPKTTIENINFPDLIGTLGYHQEHTQNSPGIETLQRGFEDFSLVESWLSPPGTCSQKPDECYKGLHPQNPAFKINGIIQQNGFALQNAGFNHEDCDKANLNSDCEKNSPDFSMYSPQNRIKDSTNIHKEYWKTNRVRGKFMKNGTKDQMKYPNNHSSALVDDTWGRAFHENQRFPKRYDDYDTRISQLSNHASSYHFNQQFPKENNYPGVANGKHVDCSENNHSSFPFGGNFVNAENKAHLSLKDGLLKAPEYDSSLNNIPQNGNFSYNGHTWLDGKSLNSTSKSNVMFGKQKQAVTSPQLSSGVSTMSSGSPTHSSVVQPSYYSQVSPVPFSKKDGRLHVPNSIPSSLGFCDNQKLCKPVGYSHFDTLTNKEDQFRKMPTGFSTNWTSQQNSVNDNHEKYHRLHRKQNQGSNSNKDDRRGRRSWIPQSGYVGHNHQQFNVFQKKQEQNGGNLSDFINPSFLPSFPLVPDFKQNPNFPPFNPHAFSAATNFGFPPSSFPFSEIVDLFHHDDFNHLNPFINDLFCGEITTPYFAFPTPFNKYKPPRNRSGPANELHIRLEECYEQWRALEKERKKTEADLARNFPGRRVSSSNNTPVSRLPLNPSRVDRLIVDELREQARVVTLVGKMEKLRGSSVHSNISATLEHHLEAILVTQARRKDEIVNAANRQRQAAPRYNNEKEVLALAAAIKELAVATRKARTALWCALQLTLPKTSLNNLVKQEDVERALQELCPGVASMSLEIHTLHEDRGCEKERDMTQSDSGVIAEKNI